MTLLSKNKITGSFYIYTGCLFKPLVNHNSFDLKTLIEHRSICDYLPFFCACTVSQEPQPFTFQDKATDLLLLMLLRIDRKTKVNLSAPWFKIKVGKNNLLHYIDFTKLLKLNTKEQNTAVGYISYRYISTGCVIHLTVSFMFHSFQINIFICICFRQNFTISQFFNLFWRLCLIHCTIFTFTLHLGL